MSISHKAYFFDYSAFERELSQILYSALQDNDFSQLVGFINNDSSRFTDPADEQPLSSNWAEERELNVQWCADIALSAYYDWTDSRGLNYGFDALDSYLRLVPEIGRDTDLFVGGSLFGPPGKRLDPGCMGTGMLSSRQAVRIHERLAGIDWIPIPSPGSSVFAGCYYKPESVEEVEESRDRLVRLYHDASAADVGLLFVDFNDRGVAHM
ncbi:MAG: hypothetical protein ACFCD0_17660 [Gemmataceae bacterium]